MHSNPILKYSDVKVKLRFFIKMGITHNHIRITIEKDV